MNPPDPHVLSQARFLAIQASLEPGTLPYVRHVRANYARLGLHSHPGYADCLASLDRLIEAHAQTPGGYNIQANAMETPFGIAIVKFAPAPKKPATASSLHASKLHVHWCS